MSLIARNPPSIHTLPIHSPGHPENYVCSPILGQDIIPLDCQTAVDTNWPKGRTPVHYYFRDPSPSNSIHLPISDHYDSCTVSIEPAGPIVETPKSDSEQQNYFSLSPNVLRGVAGFIIQKCAQEQRGMGGFVTLRFAAAETWLASLAGSANEHGRSNETMGRPNDGAFLTLSITNPSGFGFRPGDTDPAVAATLSASAANLSILHSENRHPYRGMFFGELAQRLRYKTQTMKRGRGDGETWWEGLDDGWRPWKTGTGPNRWSHDTESTGSSPGADDEGEEGNETDGNNNMTFDSASDNNGSDMTYQCDAHLGAPTASDCENLAWSGLKPPDTIETLQPHIPNIYNQGTCALGISSPSAITISWAHLLAAFETLNTLCVQNPIRGVKGGRAFYGVQGVSSWINGKREVRGKRESVAGVSGAHALPLGVNTTVWRHEGSGRAVLECEWGKAVDGKDVRGCEGD